MPCDKYRKTHISYRETNPLHRDLKLYKSFLNMKKWRFETNLFFLRLLAPRNAVMRQFTSEFASRIQHKLCFDLLNIQVRVYDVIRIAITTRIIYEQSLITLKQIYTTIAK
jgi:hypothetical protein